MTNIKEALEYARMPIHETIKETVIAFSNRDKDKYIYDSFFYFGKRDNQFRMCMCTYLFKDLIEYQLTDANAYWWPSPPPEKIEQDRSLTKYYSNLHEDINSRILWISHFMDNIKGYMIGKCSNSSELILEMLEDKKILFMLRGFKGKTRGTGSFDVECPSYFPEIMKYRGKGKKKRRDKETYRKDELKDYNDSSTLNHIYQTVGIPNYRSKSLNQ